MGYEKGSWIENFPAAITVCDTDGVIVEMNERAKKTFASGGGGSLIGQNLLGCHPEPARSKLKRLLASGERNCYTIEKNGVKKMIYQCPWYDPSPSAAVSSENERPAARYAGFVEMSFEIPFEMPHFVRKSPE